jgi:galactokinase
VIDSGISHRNAASDYSRRRLECEQAARSLGVAELRDVGIADLDRVSRLPEPFNRRARHIVTENQRVLDTVAALLRSDLAAVGGLFSQSHASMRDDFQISLPDIDRLVDIARQTHGVYGARLTGGGFGGAVVILSDAAAKSAPANIRDRYIAATGRPARILVCGNAR